MMAAHVEESGSVTGAQATSMPGRYWPAQTRERALPDGPWQRWERPARRPGRECCIPWPRPVRVRAAKLYFVNHLALSREP